MANGIISEVVLKFRREGEKALEATRDTIAQISREAKRLSGSLQEAGKSDTGLNSSKRTFDELAKKVTRYNSELNNTGRKLTELRTLYESSFAAGAKGDDKAKQKAEDYGKSIQKLILKIKRLEQAKRAAGKQLTKLPSEKISGNVPASVGAEKELAAINAEIAKERRRLAVQQNSEFKKQQRELERIRAKTELIRKENLANDRALAKTTNQMKRLRQATNTTVASISSLTKIFAVVLAGLAVQGTVRQLREASKAIGEIQTITDTTVESQKTLRSELVKLSKVYGTDLSTNAKGLYQLISAGVQPGIDANTLLEKSIRASIAGITDVETVVDGLTTIMNAWGLTMQDADGVLDKLFTTVRLGKTDFENLSKFMFQVAPVAATLRVGIDEVLASIISLTKQGTPARVAFTQVRQSMQGLIRENELLSKTFLDAGFASGKAAFQTLGYKGTLELVNRAANGNVAVLQKMTGSIEGLQAVLGVSSQQGTKFFSEGAQALEESAGAMDDAFNLMAKTIDTRFNKSLQRGKETLLKLGLAAKKFINNLLDAFDGLMGGISNFATNYSGVISVIAKTGSIIASVVVSVFVLSKAWGLLTLLAGPAIKLFAGIGRAIGFITVAITSLIGVTESLGAALGFIFTKFVPIVGVVSAVVLAYKFFTDATDKVRTKYDQLNEKLSKANGMEDQQKKAEALRDVMAETRKEMDNLVKQVHAEEIALKVSVKQFGENSKAAQDNRNRIAELNKKHKQLTDLLKKSVSSFKQFKKEVGENNTKGDFSNTIVDSLLKLDKKIADTKKRLAELGNLESDQSSSGASAQAAETAKLRQSVEKDLAKLQQRRVEQQVNLLQLEDAKLKQVIDTVKKRITLESSLNQAQSQVDINNLDIQDAKLRQQLQQREIDYATFYDKVAQIQQEKLDSRVSVAQEHADKLKSLLSVIPDNSKTVEERRKLGAELIKVEQSIQQAIAARMNDTIRGITAVNNKLRQLAQERFSINNRFETIQQQLREKDLSASEIAASRLSQIEELQAQKRTAIRKGEFAKAKRLINQIVTTYQSLAGTIQASDGSKVVATERDRVAISRELENSKRDLLRINELEQSSLLSKKKAEKESLDTLKQKLEEAKKAVEASKVKFQIDDSDIQKLYSELDQVRQQIIETKLDDTSLSKTKAELDELTKDRTVNIKTNTQGGNAPGFKDGGQIRGPGTGTSDSILAWLSNREYIIPTKAVDHYGVGFFERIRNLQLPKFATGGLVTPRLPLSDATGSGNRDVVDVNLNFGGQTFQMQGSSDVVAQLTDALKRQQLMSAG